MSTRSNIGILNGNGTVTAIYCHWDGYIEYTGKILSEHYQEIEKAKELISGGDLSSLHPKIKPTGAHSFDNPQDDVCVYYHRDRGENWEQTKPKTFKNIFELYNASKKSWCEYLYIYIGNDWYYTKTYDENFCLTLKHLKSGLELIKKKEDEEEEEEEL